MKKESIPTAKESAPTFLSRQWQDKLKELQRDKDLLCKVISSGDELNVYITAIDVSSVNGIAENVKM